MDWITGVVQNSDGSYLVNNEIYVPSDPSNRQYREVQSWIAAGNRPAQPDMEQLKAEKRSEILAAFLRAQEQGSRYSSTLGKDVNRGSVHLRNVESLIVYLQANERERIQFRCYDDTFVQVTLEELMSLKLEMISWGLELYQRKWELEDLVDQCQNRADLEEIDVGVFQQ